MLEQELFVQKEEFRPHVLIDACDPGQVTEGIAGIIDQVGVVVTGHQTDRDDMGELRDKPDHLVMFLRCQDGDLAEAEEPAQSLAPGYTGSGVFLSGGHNEVGSAEDPVVRVLDPADLTAGHRMGRDVFYILPEHILDLIDDAAFHTGHIRDQEAVFKEKLMLPDPFLKNLRIQGKDHHVRLADRRLVRISISFVNDPVFDGIIDRFLSAVDRFHLEPQSLKPLCQASAHQAQAYDQNVIIADPVHHNKSLLFRIDQGQSVPFENSLLFAVKLNLYKNLREEKSQRGCFYSSSRNTRVFRRGIHAQKGNPARGAQDS